MQMQFQDSNMIEIFTPPPPQNRLQIAFAFDPRKDRQITLND